MPKKPRTFYQLLIEVRVDADWQGTVFRSMLYPSEEACIEGCCTKREELEEIAETISRFSDYAVNENKVRDWLRSEAETPYNENDEKHTFWIITANQVAK
jgi:hypothetical protein